MDTNKKQKFRIIRKEEWVEEKIPWERKPNIDDKYKPGDPWRARGSYYVEIKAIEDNKAIILVVEENKLADTNEIYEVKIDISDLTCAINNCSGTIIKKIDDEPL